MAGSPALETWALNNTARGWSERVNTHTSMMSSASPLPQIIPSITIHSSRLTSCLTGWPLSRQCKIPWHFPDGSQHSCPRWVLLISRDVRILRQKIANSAHDLQILQNISTRFFYGTIVCDTGVLSRVSWLVGPLKLRFTIQLTLCLALLKMHCVSRCQCCSAVVHFAEKKLTRVVYCVILTIVNGRLTKISKIFAFCTIW